MKTWPLSIMSICVIHKYWKIAFRWKFKILSYCHLYLTSSPGKFVILAIKVNILKPCTFEASLAGLRYVEISFVYWFVNFVKTRFRRFLTPRLQRLSIWHFPRMAGDWAYCRTREQGEPITWLIWWFSQSEDTTSETTNDVTRHLTQFTLAHCLFKTDTS